MAVGGNICRIPVHSVPGGYQMISYDVIKKCPELGTSTFMKSIQTVTMLSDGSGWMCGSGWAYLHSSLPRGHWDLWYSRQTCQKFKLVN